MPDEIEHQESETEQETQEQEAATAVADFQWGDDAPDYLKGKSQAETVDFINNLVSEAQQLFQQGQAGRQTATQPQNNQQEEAVSNLQDIDPDLMLTDPKAWQQQFTQQLQQMQQNQMSQAAAPLLQQQAESAKFMSSSDPKHKPIYEKWGNEVDRVVGQAIQAGAMPSKQLYDQAAKMVAADHLDELAQERAKSLAASNPDLARGGTAGSSAAAGEKDEVWSKIESSPIGKQLMSTIGKEGIRRNCQNSGTNLEDYAKMVASNRASIDPLNKSRWNTTIS